MGQIAIFGINGHFITNFPVNNSRIWNEKKSGIFSALIFEGVQFGAARNKNVDLAGLDVVSWGDRWDSAEERSLLSAILVWYSLWLFVFDFNHSLT